MNRGKKKKKKSEKSKVNRQNFCDLKFSSEFWNEERDQKNSFNKEIFLIIYPGVIYDRIKALFLLIFVENR